MKEELNQNFWQQRYEDGQTGWDIGSISTPLKEYFDQLQDKELKILIPGCGNAYEAEYLYKNGFKNVNLIDIAPTPLQNFLSRNPCFPEEKLLCQDFFKHKGQYDLIIEQTFFCAIEPRFREDYVKQCHQLLKEKGKIVGLLFNDLLNSDKPPFGGNKEDYMILLSEYFLVHKMESSYNSIAPRAGRELFFISIKP
jgi:methyl halide transferase